VIWTISLFHKGGLLTQRALVNSRHEDASTSIGEKTGRIGRLGHGLIAVVINLGYRNVVPLVDLGTNGRLTHEHSSTCTIRNLRVFSF
jgi:hypothetical protein